MQFMAMLWYQDTEFLVLFSLASRHINLISRYNRYKDLTSDGRNMPPCKTVQEMLCTDCFLYSIFVGVSFFQTDIYHFGFFLLMLW